MENTIGRSSACRLPLPADPPGGGGVAFQAVEANRDLAAADLHHRTVYFRLNNPMLAKSHPRVIRCEETSEAHRADATTNAASSTQSS